MKKIFFILMISISLSLIIKWDCIQGKAVNLEQVMASALDSTGADIFSTSLNAVGQLDENLDRSDMEQIINSSIEYLSLDKDSLDINKDYSDNVVQITARGQDADKSIITIKIDSILTEKNKRENTLMIDVFHDEMLNIGKMMNEIHSIYLKLKSQPQINTCMVGTTDEELSNDKGARIEKRVMDIFGARLVKDTGLSGKNYIYAYSPAIDNSMKIGNKYVNVNFAYRYNQEEKKTYFWIATPIITME